VGNFPPKGLFALPIGNAEATELHDVKQSLCFHPVDRLNFTGQLHLSSQFSATSYAWVTPTRPGGEVFSGAMLARCMRIHPGSTGREVGWCAKQPYPLRWRTDHPFFYRRSDV